MDSYINDSISHESTLIYQTAYVSNACADLNNDELVQMIREAHHRNTADRISSILVHQDGQFLQVIEGPKNRVVKLLDKICQDPRHSDINIFFENFISRRNYPGWGMGYLSSESEAQLNENIFQLLHNAHSLDQITYDHDIAPLLRAQYRRYMEKHPNSEAGPMPLLLPNSLSDLRDQFKACMLSHETLFDMLTNTPVDGYWVVHTARPHIGWCNANLRRYMGYESADYNNKGMWWPETLSGEDRDKLMNAIERVADDPSRSCDLLLRGKHRSGRGLWYRMRLISSDIPDQPTSTGHLVIGLISDMGGGTGQANDDDILRPIEGLQSRQPTGVDSEYGGSEIGLYAPLSRVIDKLENVCRADLSEKQLRALEESLNSLDSIRDQLDASKSLNINSASSRAAFENRKILGFEDPGKWPDASDGQDRGF